MMALAPGEAVARDLSWLDWSRPGALSADGRTVLFDEQGQGGGTSYSDYLRKTDGGPAVKLGEGVSLALSPDGRWAATSPVGNNDEIDFVPTGAGETRTIHFPGLIVGGAAWHPDGRRLLLRASKPDHLPRLYVTDMAGATPKPLTDEEAQIFGTVSPDGKWVATLSASGAARLIPFEGGEAKPLPWLDARDYLLRWSSDGRGLFVARPEAAPPRLERVDVDTGKRTVVAKLDPADKAGLVDLGYFLISADGRSYVYSYRRNLAALYVGTGVR